MSIDDGAVAPVLMGDRAPGMSVESMTRRRPRSRRRRSTLLALGVAGGVLLGACGGGDADPVDLGGATIGRPPPSPARLATPVPTAAPTMDDSDAARAQRGFQRYLDAWRHANAVERPGLDQLGAALVGRAFDGEMARTLNFMQIRMYVDLPDPALERADLLWVDEGVDPLVAEFCFLDGTRLMQMGSDQVMNDEIAAFRTRVTYEVGGASTPRVENIEYLTRAEGDVPCV